MKKFAAVLLSLALALSLCACGGGKTEAPAADTGSPAEEETSASGETAAPAGEEAGGAEEEAEVNVDWPEDTGGLAGVYKWVEMADMGADMYLLLWEDGVGSIDVVGTGTMTGVVYDDTTMQATDEGAVPQTYAYADGTLTWSYTDEDGEHVSTFVKLTEEELAAYQELGVGAVAETGENEEYETPWPEDTGGIVGVYKWSEMADMGIDANLIIWDEGVGVFDMLGVVEAVTYDDATMQTTGEGAVPQTYAYADGTLTWSYTDEDGEHVSTFVKLTADELAAYQARGIGNGE